MSHNPNPENGRRLSSVFSCTYILSRLLYGARLSILIFHRVLPVRDPLFPDLPDAERFDEILRWMKSWFNVLPLDQAVHPSGDATRDIRIRALHDHADIDATTVPSPVFA